MKYRIEHLAVKVARSIMIAFALCPCAVLFAGSTDAQRAPYPKPELVKLDYLIMDGERVELGEGHYKMVGKNRAGQIVEEREYVLSQIVREKRIARAYPSGQECQVQITTTNPLDGSEHSEAIQYDRFGAPVERWTSSVSKTAIGPKRHEKWNERTKSWEPAPERRYFDVFTGNWVEETDGFVFYPNRDFYSPTEGSHRKPRLDVNYTEERRYDAMRVIALLEKNGYAVESLATIDPPPVYARHLKQLQFRAKVGGSQTGAQRVAGLVKPFEDDLSLVAETGDDVTIFPAYELWIISPKRAQPVPAVRIVYSEPRLKDAEEARRLLREKGYTVDEVWQYKNEQVAADNVNKVFCFPHVNGTEAEANIIADIVKNIERVVPQCSALPTAPGAPYVLWIVSPR